MLQKYGLLQKICPSLNAFNFEWYLYAKTNIHIFKKKFV